MMVSIVAVFVTGLVFWSSLAAHLPIMSLYVDSLGGRDQVGWVMGSFAGGLLLCRHFLGKFTDRHGRVRSMQLGLVVAAVLPLLYRIFPNVWAIIGLRAIHGVALAAFATGYAALIGDIAPPSRRALVIGYLSLVNPLGLAIGPALGDWIREAHGFGVAFQMASLFAVLGLGGSLLITDRYQAALKPPEIASLPLWEIILTPRVRTPAFVLLSIGLIFGIISTYLPLFIREQNVGINSGLFFAAAAITQFVTRVPVARMGDRWGRGIFISFALGCYAISMAILTFAHSSQAFLGAAIVDGIAAGAAIPTLIAWLTDRTIPAERGLIMGTAWAGFDLGIAIAAPTLGSIIDSFALSTAFLIATIIAMVGLVMFITCCSDTVPESIQFALGRSKDKYAIANQT